MLLALVVVLGALVFGCSSKPAEMPAASSAPWVGSLLGSIIGLAFIRLAGKSNAYELPFGTFLSLAGVVALLYGNELIGMYVNRMILPNL